MTLIGPREPFLSRFARRRILSPFCRPCTEGSCSLSPVRFPVLFRFKISTRLRFDGWGGPPTFCFSPPPLLPQCFAPLPCSIFSDDRMLPSRHFKTSGRFEARSFRLSLAPLPSNCAMALEVELCEFFLLSFQRPSHSCLFNAAISPASSGDGVYYAPPGRCF